MHNRHDLTVRVRHEIPEKRARPTFCPAPSSSRSFFSPHHEGCMAERIGQTLVLLVLMMLLDSEMVALVVVVLDSEMVAS